MGARRHASTKTLSKDTLSQDLILVCLKGPNVLPERRLSIMQRYASIVCMCVSVCVFMCVCVCVYYAVFFMCCAVCEYRVYWCVFACVCVCLCVLCMIGYT